MIEKLNNTLRVLFILLGGVFFLFKMIEKIDLPERPEPEGFQTEEFDDIW